MSFVYKLTAYGMAIFSVIAVNTVIAQNNDFYVDGGLSYHKFEIAKRAKGVRVNDSKLYKNDNAGIDFTFGKRFGDFGMELGYTIMGTDGYYKTTMYNNTKVIQTLKHENTNFHADVNSYYNLFDNLELKTIVGLGVLETKTKYNVIDHVKNKLIPEIKNNEAEIKPRLGAGLQYSFTRALSAEVAFNYQGGNKYFKAMRTTMAGVSYRL